MWAPPDVRFVASAVEVVPQKVVGDIAKKWIHCDPAVKVSKLPWIERYQGWEELGKSGIVHAPTLQIKLYFQLVFDRKYFVILEISPADNLGILWGSSSITHRSAHHKDVAFIRSFSPDQLKWLSKICN